jgi:hypothetical protein
MAEMTGSRRGIDEPKALSVFESIKKAMELDANLVLDIEWRLYRQGGRSR